MLKSSRKLVTLLLLTTLFSVLEHAYGAPISPISKTSVVRRAEGSAILTSVQKVHTEHTTVTAQGPVTEICDITLTPFKAPDGCDLVREDRVCVITFKSTISVGSNGGNNDTSTDSNTSTSSSDTNTSNSDTNTSGSDTSTITGTNGISNNGGNAGASILSTGSVDATAATQTAASASATDSAAVAGGGASVVSTGSTGAATATLGSGSVLGDNNGGAGATPTTTDTSGTAAAASSSAAAFQLPGTKLSVLPIGLAVFAGVSVIALIVVGLVTYERTKYRRAFRQRRLAEQGGAPGMSQVS